MITPQLITKLLDQNQIKYQLTTHPPVKTSRQAAQVRGAPLETGAKAMIVKTKTEYLLAVVRADQRLDWKKLKKILGVKSIRLATETEAEQLTGLKMGSVPPFGNLMGLPTYFDQLLIEQPIVNFNIASRSQSIQMATADLVNLVQPTVARFSI